MLGLIVVLLLVLVLPFTFKIIERNLELFLLGSGMIAGVLSDVFDGPFLTRLFTSPLQITAAVFIAGILFRVFQTRLDASIHILSKRIPLRLFLALIILLLGMMASIITAIIAALLLVTIVKALQLDRPSEIKFTVIACFSIGMGAVLTPIGEPLSTIATHKLNEDFFFLFTLLGPIILPSLFLFSFLAVVLIHPVKKVKNVYKAQKESFSVIVLRSFKIYIFVMALTLLGASFEPFIARYLLDVSPLFLYWLNMISAVLDNATLAAAEISPQMNHETIRAILLGLLISGGMLIPGNIPNIIAANQLNMTSKEWARFGLPFGFIMMAIFFVLILFI